MVQLRRCRLVSLATVAHGAAASTVLLLADGEDRQSYAALLLAGCWLLWPVVLARMPGRSARRFWVPVSLGLLLLVPCLLLAFLLLFGGLPLDLH